MCCGLMEDHNLHLRAFKTSQNSGVSRIRPLPYYPESNSKIEATVKSMKKIIATSWDTRTLDENKLCYAILQYRNTPSHKDGLSPAQKLYGRPIRDTLPAHHHSFAPEWQRSTQAAEQQAANSQKHFTTPTPVAYLISKLAHQ